MSTHPWEGREGEVTIKGEYWELKIPAQKNLSQKTSFHLAIVKITLASCELSLGFFGWAALFLQVTKKGVSCVLLGMFLFI